MRTGTSCILPWSGGADAPVSIAVPIVSTIAVSAISVPIASPAVSVSVPAVAVPAITVAAVSASGTPTPAPSPGNRAPVSRGQAVVAAAEGTADVGAHPPQDRGDADAEQPQQQGVLDQALATAVPKQGAPTRGHMGSE